MERRRTDGTRRGDFKGEHRWRDGELTALGDIWRGDFKGENRWRDVELTALGETLRERTDGET